MKFPEDVPTLTDGVVTLRAHHGGDVQALHEQAVDPVMLRWTTVPDPSTRETARQFATEIIPDGWRSDSEWAFAVEASDTDGTSRFVGTVSLRNEGHRRAEIAYGTHPWARGRGYVVRALELLLAWGFAEKDLRTVIWWANQGNWASRKVAWRLGFSFDGTVRQWLPQRGVLYDGWVGVLLSTDSREPRNPWFNVPRIAGEKVVLREHTSEDLPRIQEASSDKRTTYWLPDLPSPYTLEDAEKYLEGRRQRHAEGSGLSWAIADPDTDEFLGNISLFDLKQGHKAKIGYWSHPAVRGRGVMTEACGLVLRHAFIPEEDGGMGLRCVQICAAEGNTASRRVIEANGFVATGRERNGSKLGDGSLVDTLAYDLLAEEYTPKP